MGQRHLLPSGSKFISKWGKSYFKIGQLLQEGGKCYFKVGQLFRSGAQQYQSRGRNLMSGILAKMDSRDALKIAKIIPSLYIVLSNKISLQTVIE